MRAPDVLCLESSDEVCCFVGNVRNGEHPKHADDGADDYKVCDDEDTALHVLVLDRIKQRRVLQGLSERAADKREHECPHEDLHTR